MHERALQRIGCDQRLVALDQRPLHVHAVGDVAEGDERVAVGQRQSRAIEHAAVDPLQPPLDRRTMLERRYRELDGAERFLAAQPAAQERAGPAGNRIDMRPRCERLRRKLPHLGKDRIVQLEPAVGAEHGDGFGQRLERFALRPVQRVEAALQLDALADVVEQISDAVLRVGVGDHAQVPAAGQIPAVLLGLDGAIGLQQLRLPGAEVGLFREPALGPEPVEDRRIRRPLVEKGGIELEQRAISGVIEHQPPVGAEDRNCGCQLVERAPVRGDDVREFGPDRLGLGRVDADTGGAARARDLDDIEYAPLSRDDRRQTLGESAALGARTQRFLARAAIEQLEPARDRVIGVARFDGQRISVVGENEAALGVADPDRRRHRREQCAHFLHLGLEPAERLRKRRVVEARAGELPQPQHRGTRDRPALDLDMARVAGAPDAAEGFAAAPERIDGRFHFARGLGLQPGAERQEPPRRRLTRELSRVAEDERLGLLFAPGHDHLRLAQEDRIGPVELVFQARDLALCPIERTARTHAGSQVGDRNHHGEDEDAERERERGDLVALEAGEHMKIRSARRR